MKEVKAVFNALDESFTNRDEYINYWGGLTVTNDADYFRRWLFAFCSVHTTWERNVIAYTNIKNFHEWEDDKAELRRRLITARAGLYNNRTEYIWAFHADFWADPKQFYNDPHEPWWNTRNRLEARIKGLGLAKTSFALEMSFPLEAEIVCLDVHMMRLYGKEEYNGRASYPVYEKMETDWSGRSQKLGIPPYIARCAYWDRVQNQPDSRYWSKALENSV